MRRETDLCGWSDGLRVKERRIRKSKREFNVDHVQRYEMIAERRFGEVGFSSGWFHSDCPCIGDCMVHRDDWIILRLYHIIFESIMNEIYSSDQDSFTKIFTIDLRSLVHDDTYDRRDKDTLVFCFKSKGLRLIGYYRNPWMFPNNTLT